MKSVFDKPTRDQLIHRIDSLNEQSSAQWGKMNIYQMLRHCTVCDEMFLGKKHYKRVFLGRLLGKIGLRNMLKNDAPLKQGSPTGTAFKIKEKAGDIEGEKKKWISLVEEYANYSIDPFQHWFFGKMTKEQVGWFVYKHNDHHLRQFNA